LRLAFVFLPIKIESLTAKIAKKAAKIAKTDLNETLPSTVTQATSCDNWFMLRDKNLVPLSHQHQHALALCVRLDRALQAGPVEAEAWQAEIQQIVEQEINIHFAAEEKEVFPEAEGFPELQQVVKELAAEHVVLRSLFEQAAARTLDTDGLRKFVDTLAQHIRKEERQLFEGLQKVLGQDKMVAMGAALERALAQASGSCIIPNEATRLRPKR
jgi:hemerythrin-like domain-containing protein